MTSDRVPPQNLEAEQSVLGACILDRDAITTARAMLTPGSFYREVHARIFAAICSLADQREPVDLVTLSAELQTRGDFESVGGGDYLMQLASAVPSARMAQQYAQLVKDSETSRRLLSAFEEVEAFCYQSDAAGALGAAQARLHGILSDTQTGTGPKHVGEGLYSVREAMEARNKAALEGRYNRVTGLPTGIGSLDRITGGLQAGNLWVVGGRPSMGKTALALNIATHVAGKVRPEGQDGVSRESCVLFVSLEMRYEAIEERIMCAEASVDSQAPRFGQLQNEDRERLDLACSRLYRMSLYIEDTPRLSAQDITSRAMKLKAETGCLDLVCVDYIGRMRLQRAERHDIAVGRAIGELKDMSLDLSVPVIALCQLSRAVEKRTTDPDQMRPMLSDLKDSGVIEADADVILFPWRPQYATYRRLRDKGMDDVEEPSAIEDAEILVEKNRDGMTGTARVVFSGPHRRFFDRAPGHREERTQ